TCRNSRPARDSRTLSTDRPIYSNDEKAGPSPAFSCLELSTEAPERHDRVTVAEGVERRPGPFAASFSSAPIVQNNAPDARARPGARLQPKLPEDSKGTSLGSSSADVRRKECPWHPVSHCSPRWRRNGHLRGCRPLC